MVALLLAGGATAAAADAAKINCKMTFALTEWAAAVEHATGAGSISCDNGQTAEVTLTSTGGGLAAGKFRIEGRGEFSGVRDIGDLFGNYLAAEGNAGVIKAGAATVLTKGEVSVALAGKGEGWDVGVSPGKFTIEPRR